jgi:hypothetical protein
MLAVDFGDSDVLRTAASSSASILPVADAVVVHPPPGHGKSVNGRLLAELGRGSQLPAQSLLDFPTPTAEDNRGN